MLRIRIQITLLILFITALFLISANNDYFREFIWCILLSTINAFEILKEKLEREARPLFCPKCRKEIKPIVRLYPTLLGEVKADFLCPIHNIVLLTETIRKMMLPERRPQLVREGVYIAFEGIDGSGKTFFAKWLVEELKKKGYDVIYVIEPHIKAIKDFLYKYDIDADAEAYIFAADRIILQKTTILPALREGKIVISDRSIYASIAYQTVRGLDEEFIWGINREIKIPELVIVLDVPASVALERIKNAGRSLTRFEEKEFLEKVRRKYKEIIKRYTKLSQFILIDADRKVEDVKQDILNIVLEYIRGKLES